MESLKGIDIFLFKAYMEKTATTNLGGRSIILLTEILVNSLFYVLNIIVLFSSTVLKTLENFSVYNSYRFVIYDTSKAIWNVLIGKESGYTGSVFWGVLTLFVFYLFGSWAFSRGNFTRKVVHVLVAIGVSFAYFGTIQQTSGGLYLLDGVRKLSQEAIKVVNTVSVQISEDNVASTTFDFSEKYIEETSYEAYLYANTGQIDGNYYNAKTEKTEAYPTSEILGTVDESGNFKEISAKERLEAVDKLGHGADDNKESNRWNSAVFDRLLNKLFYVLASIYKALILPVPYIVVHLFRIVGEILVLILMLGFPFFIVATFIPSVENYLVGVVKLFMIALVSPSIGSFMILVVAVINKVISLKFASMFAGDTATGLLMNNVSFSVVSIFVYWLFWIGKGFIFSILAGGSPTAANVYIDGTDRIVDSTRDSFNHLDELVRRKMLFYNEQMDDLSPEELNPDEPTDDRKHTLSDDGMDSQEEIVDKDNQQSDIDDPVIEDEVSEAVNPDSLDDGSHLPDDFDEISPEEREDEIDVQEMEDENSFIFEEQEKQPNTVIITEEE